MKTEPIPRIPIIMIILLVISGFSLVTGKQSLAASSAEINKEVGLALEKLYASSPTAVEFSKVAKGVLVFPRVIKAGLVVGGQYGEGALLIDGKNAGYFNTISASYGLQGSKISRINPDKE